MSFEKYIISPLAFDIELQGSKLRSLTFRGQSDLNSSYEEIKLRPGVKRHRKQIENWSDYATELKELDQELFFEYFLKDLPEDELVLMLTNEEHANNCAFRFVVRDFYSFSDQYEDQYHMEFFQFSYYLLAYPRAALIRFIDDDGGVHEYRFK